MKLDQVIEELMDLRARVGDKECSIFVDIAHPESCVFYDIEKVALSQHSQVVCIHTNYNGARENL